jgi:hypothetical protein
MITVFSAIERHAQSGNQILDVINEYIEAGAAQEILQDFLISTRINLYEKSAKFLCVLVSSFLATVVSRYNKSTALKYQFYELLTKTIIIFHSYFKYYKNSTVSL